MSYTESGEKECGLLTKSMYGTQDAPNIRQSHYTGLLESVGISRGKSNASVFYRDRDGIRIVVHGDDFLVLGDDQGLQEVDDLLRSTYELKRLGTLGFDKGDDRQRNTLLESAHSSRYPPRKTSGLSGTRPKIRGFVDPQLRT